MNWIPLTDSAQLDEIIKKSYGKPIAIFKHSTRCSVSSMSKRMLERDWNASADQVPVYFLDLLAYRSISDEIAHRFSVTHQSPQLILIKDGKAVYHASHEDINVADMISAV